MLASCVKSDAANGKKARRNNMPAEIISAHGHYEVYINGNFCCSADTYAEAVKEIEQLEV